MAQSLHIGSIRTPLLTYQACISKPSILTLRKLDDLSKKRTYPPELPENSQGDLS